MMKLLEVYANACSVEIQNKPTIYETYFPLSIQKYITIQNTSGMPAKNYSYFRTVIDLLYPILDKENIKMVILGENSPPLNHTINLSNQTTIHQSYYILKKSLLHLGNDSWLLHAAGAENIPIVGLYGPTTIKNHAPYFSDEDKTVLLESDRGGMLPSYSPEETPRTIDFIKPEDIVRAVCKLLNLDFSFPYKTLHRGQKFNSGAVFETVPNQAIQLQSLGIDSILVRMDYFFNENALAQQLQLGNATIVTNKPINIEILKGFAPRIRELVYFIDENHNPEFAEEAKKLNINTLLISELDMEVLRPIKLYYMDLGIINHRPKMTKDSIDAIKGKDSLYYQSNKFTLSAGKIYMSKAAYLQDKPLNNFSFEFQPVIDSPEFWNESDTFWLTSK